MEFNIIHSLFVLLNFFYLSKDDEECAKYHGDRHLHKMIVEHTQILSYVWHTLHPDHEITKTVYKASKGHQKHPVTLWALKSIKHYRKIASVTTSLLKERLRRGFDKPHKTGEILQILILNEPSIEDCGWIDPPKCMPAEYHCDVDGNQFDVVRSYRLLYAGDKVEIAGLKWEPRAKDPEWLPECKEYVNSRSDIRKGIDERKKKSDVDKQKKRERSKRKRDTEFLNDFVNNFVTENVISTVKKRTVKKRKEKETPLIEPVFIP